MSNNLAPKVFRFRRFCRASYAVFRSLHIEVTIGRVATYIADRQMRKSARTVALCLMIMMAGKAMAQSDDDLEGLTLPMVSITASGDTAQSPTEGACAVLTHHDIQHLSANTIGQLLEMLPSVDVRSRGVGDMQGDITLRGGTFDQVVVLLNGINISDPQTGHHNLDLPIDLAMVERIELLSASALVRYGVTAFCGGINIVTVPSSSDRVRARLSAGSHGTTSAALRGDKRIGRWNIAATGAYNRSDGYRPNTDYRNANALLYASRRDTLGTWQALYGRLHRDRFELFRQGAVKPPSWYGGHNYHLSSSCGARLRASRLNLQNAAMQGRLTLGIEYRRDGIISNVLGDSLAQKRRVLFENGEHYYTLGCSRHRGSAFAEQSLYVGDWEMAAAALVHANSAMPSGYGYSLSASWHPTPAITLSAAIGRSDRQPTFTDLYYHSATQIANPLLHSETSHSAEFAAKYHKGLWHASTDIYLRRGTDIIDWVRQPDESVWHSMNHSRIDAIGFDMNIGYHSDKFVLYADLTYCYNTIDKEAKGYVSQYALDYLRHKVSANIAISPAKPLVVKASLAYHYRIGGYTDLSGTMIKYSPVCIINAAIEYHLKKWIFFVEASNLLNRIYYDYGGIPLPGTTWAAGVNTDF